MLPHTCNRPGFFSKLETKVLLVTYPVSTPEIVPEDVAEEVDGGRHQPCHQAIFPDIVFSRANKGSNLNQKENEKLLLSNMKHRGQ